MHNKLTCWEMSPENGQKKEEIHVVNNIHQILFSWWLYVLKVVKEKRVITFKSHVPGIPFCPGCPFSPCDPLSPEDPFSP